MPVVVDLFSGAGGLSLGFRMAGFTIALATDKDANAKQTYMHNNPGVQFLQEPIEDLNGNKILDIVANRGFSDVDVVIGGPPCQAFSFANRQSQGVGNPNSHGVWEFVRLVEELKPVMLVMENVAGIRSLEHGELLGKIRMKLERVGYKTWSEILMSADFSVPQYRKRNFLFGTRLGVDLQSSYVKRAMIITVGNAIGDLPSLPEGGGGIKITEYFTRAQTKYQRAMRRGAAKLYNHLSTKSGRRNPNVVERFKYIPQGKTLTDVWEVLPTRLKEGIHCVEKGVVHSNIYRRLHWDQPAPTIVHVRKAVLIHPLQDRLLSVREAARLQSFPDTFRFFGGVSEQYQQVADAVPPRVAYAVAKKITRIYWGGKLRKSDQQNMSPSLQS